MSVPHADSDSSAEENLVPYRAVSGWAITALVLGALSALAMVGPLLWAVPLSAFVAALVAMRKIKSSAGELVGWNMALLGLLLAILFGVAAPSHSMSRRHWLETRAGIFADQFMHLLQQGHGDIAYQLLVYPVYRKPLDSDLAAQYAKDPKTEKDYEIFLRRDLVKTLLAHHGDVSIEQLETQWLTSDDDNDLIMVRYRISYPDNGANVSSIARLTLWRGPEYATGRDQWRIQSMNVN